MYDDDYPTCHRTYVTLRIYHEHAHPSAVSERLGIDPTDIIVKGDKKPSGFVIPRHGWFLTSKDRVQSKDVRRHLDWLFTRIQHLKTPLQALASSGYQLDVSVFWDSESGHGGPTLSPAQLSKLVDFGLEIWFDVYLWDGDDEDPEPWQA